MRIPSSRPVFLIALVLMMVIVSLSGCAKAQEATVTPSATDLPAPTVIITATPGATPVPAGNTALAPAQIFHKVSPSVAFVETSIGSGSGFLVEGGYLVTNAHVVWPYNTVRVVFPDGSEYQDAPVINWDLMVDLAVIGPLKTDLPPVTTTNGEDLAIGESVYLIGYPAEMEEFPQPTITSGIISHFREWEQGGITFIQSDAVIVGGQSGGVLTSAQGDVIGISGLGFPRFPSGKFALVASAADVMPRVQKMIAGENTDGLNRPIPQRPAGGKKKVEVRVKNYWDEDVFMFWPEAGDLITMELNTESELNLGIVGAIGNPPDIKEQREFSNIKAIEFQPEYDELHFAIIGPRQNITSLEDLLFAFSDEEPSTSVITETITGTLTSSIPLHPFSDPDDWSQVSVGETIRGAIDYPNDIDTYQIQLNKGQTIHILAESMATDLHVSVVTIDESQPLAEDDDTGGGIYDMNAELSFRAPENGDYLIVITDQTGVTFGSGYFLTVGPYEKEEPTPIAPTPTPAPVVTRMGKMAVYRWPFTPQFSMQYPADWTAAPENEFCNSYGDELDCFGNDWNGVRFLILKEGDVDWTSEQDVIDAVASEMYDVEVISKKRLVNPNGYEFHVFHLFSEDAAEHAWIAVTNVNGFDIIAHFDMIDVDAMSEDEESKDEEESYRDADETYEDRYPGGPSAFEAMVMQSVASFDLATH